MNRGREGTCKRACCWSPQGVCCRRGLCACHTRSDLEDHAQRERQKQAEMRHQEVLFARQDREIELAEEAGLTWTP